MPGYREIGKRYRNWGRWGEDDERGTLNLISEDDIAAAARLVRRGAVFELGVPFDSQGPQLGGARINPVHLMSATGDGQDFPGGFRYADDYVFMPLQCASQWDSLAHVYYDELLYNGVPASAVNSFGAARNSIDRIGPGIVGRGVLLDIAGLHEVPWLEEAQVVRPDDLDGAARKAGVEIRTGDILLVRTGWHEKLVREGNATDFMAGEPGIGLECVEWFHDHQVAVLASDNWGIEVVPAEDPSETHPVHCVLIRDLGMTLGEMFDLERLAADCAADGSFEFLFCGTALKVTGGVGSPVNPVAIK